MYKKCAGLVIGFGLIATAANAGTITVDKTDITFSGGAAGGYYYSTNTGSTNKDNMYLSDFLTQFSHDAKAAGDVGFTAGVGELQRVTVLDGGGTKLAKDTVDLKYGWVTAMPVENLSLQIGKLATNVGSELATSYANPNITLGALWNSQPLYYRGIRANYTAGPVTVYAEADNDDTAGKNANAVGVSGSAGGVNYVASYFNYLRGINYFDVVLNGSVGGTDVGLNFDYDTQDKAIRTTGTDHKGYGLALFVTPKSGKMSLPVRLEYLNQGTSGDKGGTAIFGLTDSVNSPANVIKSAYTFTVTPTYHYTDTTFIRAEFSYVSMDKSGFYSDKHGTAKDTKSSFALQVGTTF